MKAELGTIRRDRTALVAELEAAGAKVRGTTVRCPFHDDQHPSGSLYADESGVWRFKCHTCGFGGDVFDVRAKACGQSVKDAIRDFSGRQARPQGPPTADKVEPMTLSQLRERHPEAEAVYEYTNPVTRKIDMVVIRLREPGGGKRFLQCRPEGGGFVYGAPPKPWALYNRSRVAGASRVVVVEGEGVVHALHSVGITATTSPGGAENADKADWTPLAGKAAVVWPDNDAKGIQYGRDVAQQLEALEPRPTVAWIDPGSLGLGPKGDAADFIDTLADLPVEAQREAVEAVLASAVPLGPAGDLIELVEATIDGRRRAIPWPWPTLSRLTKALLPGTVTLLCGEGGASKSFLALQAAAHWHAEGLRVALYELEGTRAEHLQRALAQAAGDARLTDDEWVRDAPDEARAILADHQEQLDSFGACITTAPDRPPTLGDLARWVEARAKAGGEIIVIDPITAATAAREVWVADSDFVLKVKAAIRRTGSRLVLVMHPRKGHKGAALDDLAGGAVYARLCDTALWLERHEPPKVLTVRMALGPSTFGVNRTLAILKARHGRGTGLRVAFTFSGDTLSYNEHGIVAPTPKAKTAGDEAREFSA